MSDAKEILECPRRRERVPLRRQPHRLPQPGRGALLGRRRARPADAARAGRRTDGGRRGRRRDRLRRRAPDPPARRDREERPRARRVAPDARSRREHNPGLANVEWIEGDGTSLAPIEDASADACVSHVVFQHIPDPRSRSGTSRRSAASCAPAAGPSSRSPTTAPCTRGVPAARTGSRRCSAGAPRVRRIRTGAGRTSSSRRCARPRAARGWRSSSSSARARSTASSG